MNIIYMLKNNDKKGFPNKYIGMKTECGIVKIDGNDTMVCLKTGKVYLGSSYNPVMLEDVRGGDTFSAEVLEVVIKREDLSERELYYLNKLDAVNSEEFYNLSTARLDAFLMQDVVGNCFGETIKQRATNERAMSVRDQTSVSLGFSNYGELCFHIYNKMLSGKSGKDISTELGKYRQFARRFIEDFDMETASKELEGAFMVQDKIRADRLKAATIDKLSELYGYQLPTIRTVLGDYSKDFTYRVAKEKGMTKDELELDITKRVLDGDNFEKVSKDTGVQIISVKRYFLRCIRSRLKSCDL